ncbi:MAG: azurin [Verrucomicrobiales bacterium]|jgi:azurin
MLIRFVLLLSLIPCTFLYADSPISIEITTLRGQMKYDTEEFSVPPGAKVRLTLKNEDDMHHNLIICKPGEGGEQELAKKAWELGAAGFEKQWIPEHPALLFAMPMADPKASVTLEFTAPKEPGTYPYVCTLPGHSMLMNGEMIVGGGAAPGGKNGLSELTFMLYEGNWQNLPDFSALTPTATDHVKGGLITLQVAKTLSNGFGIVFRGKLEAPVDGKYSFQLSSDDGSRLLIGGREVIGHDGIHAMSEKTGGIELTKGFHDIELRYFEGTGQEELALSWSGPGFKNLALSATQKQRNNRKAASGIPLGSLNGEAIIYRNFIQGAGSRAIGVGYPGGANIAYDADQCRVALVWQGAFIDAARHWNGRGQGFQPPLGYNLVALPEGTPLAKLATPDAPWPDDARKSSKRQPDNGYRFAGYELIGDARLPEFRFRYQETAVTDLFEPSGKRKGSHADLSRKITIRGKLDGTHYFRAAVGKSIKRSGSGEFTIDDKIGITLGSSSGAQPILRESGGSWELIIPIAPTDKPIQIEQTISWN